MTYSLEFFEPFKRKGVHYQENNQQSYTFPNGYEASVIQPYAQMELIGFFGHAEHEARELGICRNGKLDFEAAKEIGLKSSTTQVANDTQLVELLNKLYELPSPIKEDRFEMNHSYIDETLEKLFDHKGA